MDFVLNPVEMLKEYPTDHVAENVAEHLGIFGCLTTHLPEHTTHLAVPMAHDLAMDLVDIPTTLQWLPRSVV